MNAKIVSWERWLEGFSETVRARDFSKGKRLFSKGVVSFGTVCVRAKNLDELVAKQWKLVWPKTKDFKFDCESARVIKNADHAVIIAGWRSTGFRNKIPFARRGRATIVLEKSANCWKALHTHFSLEPKRK